MHQFTDDIDYTRFFWFKKKLIEDNNWALLSPSAKAIFPIIALHAGKNGIAFPSEQTMAIKAGLTDKIVRKGINDLESFPGIRCEPYRTRKGKLSKRFHVTIPKHNNSDCFPFHQSIIDTGVWNILKPTAKALYPAIRYFGSFDIDRYAEIEDLEDYYDGESEFDEVFSTRKYDFFCDVTQSYLIEHAGIVRRSIPSALESLMETGLIERLQDGYKVFIKPKLYYKRSFLNNKTREAYNHLLQEKPSFNLGVEY